MARKLRVNWDQVREFDPATVPSDLWHTALHEAGHFLSAVHHGFPIQRVWIRPPGASPRRGGGHRRGKLGGVGFWDVPGPGQIISTLAGAAVDQLRGQNDVGTQGDIEMAETQIRDSLRHGTNKARSGGPGHVPTVHEVQILLEQYLHEAKSLVECHWPIVVLLAAAFLTHSRQDGELNLGRMEMLVEMTRFILSGVSFDAWMSHQS